MKFRTQIFLFLFLFGFAPLISAVMINLPLVLDRLALFYHKAHLQNLRADFRDLDQHIASRQEMVRLLAKLPEPGAVLGTGKDEDKIDLARARYTEWINQIFKEQLDITQILFIDRQGNERFWLERDPETQVWLPTTDEPARPSTDFIEAALGAERGGVLVSLIDVDPVGGAVDPRRLMSMYLASPIGHDRAASGQPMGAVILSIDVGGMARFYRNTLWVRSDGRYLGQPPGLGGHELTAFDDFPGLDKIFASGNLSLWRKDGRQVMWVPMFRTKQGEPIWVGRSVDASPMADFKAALVTRVLAIILILILLIWAVARWFALKAERVGLELGEGIARVLEGDEPVHFTWRRPEELRRLGENLTRLSEKHVRNRRNLRAHARELEVSYRYKSEFLSNVSHELRTPLNSILLLSKMLAESTTVSPEQGQQARVIHQAGKDLQTLIDNILDLSRIEAGRAVIHLEPIVLPELLGDVIELVRPQFEAKGLTLDLQVVSDLPSSIESDPDKIRQIIKNFLSNAVKFTKTGGVVVGLALDGEAACPVRISVSDTGIGIPSDKQGVIFEAFQQADGSTSRRYGGTGLGLTISTQLAELLGGRIELKSEEGQGSTFSLLLPLSHTPGQARDNGHAEAEAAEAGPPSAPELPDTDFLGAQVLVLDDDVQTLLSLTPLLERWGLRVTVAGDYAEAIEALSEEPDCGVILMDALMPGLDACATIENLKAQSACDSVPVIALIADASEEAVQACLAAGADDVIVKPVDAQALKEMLVSRLPVRNLAQQP